MFNNFCTIFKRTISYVGLRKPSSYPHYILDERHRTFIISTFDIVHNPRSISYNTILYVGSTLLYFWRTTSHIATAALLLQAATLLQCCPRATGSHVRVRHSMGFPYCKLKGIKQAPSHQSHPHPAPLTTHHQSQHHPRPPLWRQAVSHGVSKTVHPSCAHHDLKPVGARCMGAQCITAV